VGFYYSSGDSNPGPDDKGPGGWGETLAIIWAVFRVLAVPLGVLFGAIFGLVALIWLFTVSVYIGFGIIALGIGLLVWRGVYEAKHPPDIR